MNLKRLLTYKYNNGGNVLSEQGIQKVINKYGHGKSPFKASDFIIVSRETGVPIELLLSQSILESNLGTKGAAVRTKNVGNAGNFATGKRTYHNDWVTGLRSFANTLKNEYKAVSPASVQKLINNNFARPAGSSYDPTNPNYGRSVGNMINTIYSDIYGVKSSYSSSGADVSVNSNGNQPSFTPIDTSFIQKAREQGIVIPTYNYIKDNPVLIPHLSEADMSWFNQQQKEEKSRLAAEEAEQNAMKLNEQLLKAYEEKQARTQNILSNIPTYDYVPSDYRDGGMLRNLRPNVVNFYNELRSYVPDATITSGYRANARTKQGRLSRHGKGEAIDLRYNKNLQKFLYSTEGDTLMRKYQLGMFDETIPSNLKLTGGSGPHFHIGMDFTGNSDRRNTALPRNSWNGVKYSPDMRYIAPFSENKLWGSYVDNIPSSMDTGINLLNNIQDFNSYLNSYLEEENARQDSLKKQSEELSNRAQELYRGRWQMLKQFGAMIPTMNYTKSNY